MNIQQAPPGYRWSNIIPLLLPEPQQSALTQPAPAWPRTFEISWQPIPDGPEYPLVGTTRAVSKKMHHFTVEDVREITFHVLGSKQRRSNDWKDWRICLRGKALPPAAIAAWDSTDNMMMMNWGRPPLIVIDVLIVGIRHVSTPTVWGQSDFTLAKPNFVTLSTDHPATKQERHLAERGRRLLSKFVTTMTARGNPGSGDTEEQRQGEARQRLTEAGHELLHDNTPTSVTVINLVGALNGVTTERGVYRVLVRAGWKIEDVQEAVNSVHMACRNDL